VLWFNACLNYSEGFGYGTAGVRIPVLRGLRLCSSSNANFDLEHIARFKVKIQNTRE